MIQLDLGLVETGLRAALVGHLKQKTRLGRIRPPTVQDYEQRIAWLAEVFGPRAQLVDVTYDRLLALAEQHGPDGKGLKYVTISKRLAFLKWTLTEAHERGHIARMPRFPRLPSDGTYGTDYHLSGEFEAMRAMLPQPWDTWVTLGYWTAMRRSDLHRARWAWFDLERPFVDHAGKEVAPGRWRRVSTKTARPGRSADVWLPMDPPLWTWLMKLGPGEPSELVTGAWHRANRSMARACHQADVPPLSPNGFRRSAVFRWYTEGRADEWIRVALGHVGYGHRDVSRSISDAHAQDGRTRPTVRSRHYYAAVPIGATPRVDAKRAEPDRELFEKFKEFFFASSAMSDKVG